MYKKIIASAMTAATLFSFASCSNDKPQDKETEPTTEETTASQIETTVGAQSWTGKWQADDTEENFEIYDVTDKGFSVHFYHDEEGNIELFEYDMEFDDNEHKIASQTGSADDNGGWEYTFILGDGSITVKSKLPDQTYRAV